MDKRQPWRRASRSRCSWSSRRPPLSPSLRQVRSTRRSAGGTS